MRRSINSAMSRVGNHEKRAFMNSRVRGHAIYVSSLTCRFVPSGILEPPKEMEIGFKNHIGREMGLKLHCSTFAGFESAGGEERSNKSKVREIRCKEERQFSTKALVYHKPRRLRLS